ncbi:MAB_1171c family putative transporter [Gandjariella thermophila]|uniref:DUF6545 domain-containing protein n=1 Tax=Gandjariella thermophila TaxID=1931992 RepID=A0A4D4JGR3_9PSEU|nr:MAB_1171c family putative transporter [Gandjariella thermophila]GDY33087.1 hypothetical protein GTS_47200 [Gandjariella thermophila]
MNIASLYHAGTQVELSGAAAMWVVIFLRLPGALRSRQQRMLLFAVIGLAGSITVYLDPVTALINRNLVFAQSCGLFMNAWGVFSAALILDFVLAATADRRPWTVYGLMAATIAALVTLNFTVAPHSGCVTSRFVPWYSPFWWLLIAAHLVAVIPCAVLCGRYAYRAREDRPLRAGLALLAAGFTSSAAFWTVVLGFLLARPAWLGALFPLNIGVTAWLTTAGASLPLVLEARRWTGNMAALWRLWPLWRDLVRTVPHVALSPPGVRVRDLFGGPRTTYLRLYRRVIEIRDAILILADHVDTETVERARAHVAAHGVPEGEIEAAVTACWLQFASRARAAGEDTRPGPHPRTAPQGDDLPAEIAFLLAVVRARGGAAVASFDPSEQNAEKRQGEQRGGRRHQGDQHVPDQHVEQGLAGGAGAAGVHPAERGRVHHRDTP